jgi:hypothetical protein
MTGFDAQAIRDLHREGKISSEQAARMLESHYKISRAAAMRRVPFMWRWFWLPLREHVWYPIKRWWYLG